MASKVEYFGLHALVFALVQPFDAEFVENLLQILVAYRKVSRVHVGPAIPPADPVVVMPITC